MGERTIRGERMSDKELTIDGLKKLWNVLLRLEREQFMDCVNDARELLEQSEPVRHGHWIDKPTGKYGNWQSYCSACGKHSQIESNRHKPRCPWCGAFMDEVTT